MDFFAKKTAVKPFDQIITSTFTNFPVSSVKIMNKSKNTLKFLESNYNAKEDKFIPRKTITQVINKLNFENNKYIKSKKEMEIKFTAQVLVGLLALLVVKIITI
jgi:hypothetical protein